jgi:hypothetical protein
VKESGNYILAVNNSTVADISFNYDRKESDLTSYSASDLKSVAEKSGAVHLNLLDASNKELTHSVAELNEGKKMWKYCILLVLLFLGTEVMLIRFMK